MMRAIGLGIVAIAVASACGTHGASASNDVPDASAPDAQALHPCTLASAGAATILLALDARHISAPQMTVLDPGSPTVPATVAVQAFANASLTGIPDDIELARARIGGAWPAGVAIDRPPLLVGELALGFAQLSSSPPSAGGLAIAWHREEIGVGTPRFRAFDATTWTAGDVVVLAMKGDSVLSLVPSADGYGVAWRDLNAPGVGPVTALVAILDARGTTVRGPFVAAGPGDYPGPAPSIASVGGRYVVATGFKDCGFGDHNCVARSVVLATIGAQAIARVAMIPALDAATAPGRVAIASYGDRSWIAWSEGDPKNDKAPRTVRFAALDARGIPVGEPVTLATNAHMITTASIAASDIGVVVTWAESGIVAIPQTAPGSSRVVVRHIGTDGVLAEPALVVDATFVDTYGPPTSVTIASPRGALVMWAGRSSRDGDPDVAWLARLDCAAP